MSDDAAAAVLTEQRGRVLIITLNRPDQMNAFNADQANGLDAAMTELNTNDGLTAAVLTGNGKGFSSGMDLKAFMTGEDISAWVNFIRDGAQKPIIAAVEGFALAGGLETALACDLMIASTGAKFGVPEVKRGLIAAGAGLFRLPGRIGYAKAMELAITGDNIVAEEALELGLLTQVTEVGGALDAAVELAERIAKNAPLAVAASKAVIQATQGNTEAELWAIQEPLRAKVFSSNDAKEGPTAFAEKREPNWTGT